MKDANVELFTYTTQPVKELFVEERMGIKRYLADDDKTWVILGGFPLAIAKGPTPDKHPESLHHVYLKFHGGVPARCRTSD